MVGVFIVGGATLLASFLCSLFEASLYAISPAQIEVLRERGVRGANRLARLRENVEEPISAILTINTIAHTVGRPGAAPWSARRSAAPRSACSPRCSRSSCWR